ncbi:hypothetical protein MLD38_009183 [Melastoma candidum]|uniref:Uncharacterized protein n=1 Tax=Melastoma candidum TaxID=119954 RepID=A0ACB9RY53_9MYRT|nr:hypothetical protein MLD38_009183 [Melastoma candidum]
MKLDVDAVPPSPSHPSSDNGDKENIPPTPPPPPPRPLLGRYPSSKSELPKAKVVPREPLADITHLFVNVPQVRSCSLCSKVVGWNLTSLASRKRRALGDVDPARSKALRMGFR